MTTWDENRIRNKNSFFYDHFTKSYRKNCNYCQIWYLLIVVVFPIRRCWQKKILFFVYHEIDANENNKNVWVCERAPKTTYHHSDFDQNIQIKLLIKIFAFGISSDCELIWKKEPILMDFNIMSTEEEKKRK